MRMPSLCLLYTSQPLISVYRGAGDADAVRRLRNTNYLVAIAFGFVGDVYKRQVFTFVLPQSMVRCMGFKDTKALHGAMITGTVIIGLMTVSYTHLDVYKRQRVKSKPCFPDSVRAIIMRL